jgi:hypothetical protein
MKGPSTTFSPDSNGTGGPEKPPKGVGSDGDFARPKTPTIILQPAPPTEITSRRIFQMEGKYLGSAKRGSSDCSSCVASDHIYCQARMEARHNCSKSGFNYTSIGEVWFWVPKKELVRLRIELKTPSVIPCSIVELVLVEGDSAF